MQIAMIADAGSVHTRRWALGLRQLGHRVHIWSERPWDDFDDGSVHRLPRAQRLRRDVPGAVRQIRQEVRAFNPDVVHAHYLSHYGLLAALAGIGPLVISVWGADIECFPERYGFLSRRVIRWILARAQAITCSSGYLRTITERYTAQAIRVIPFGIDLHAFRAQNQNHGPVRLIINKALEPVYGIDIILSALKEVQGSYTLRILGDGTQKPALQKLAAACHLDQRVQWVGRVDPAALPAALAWADVGLYASRRESFGVAPLEMMALGRSAVAHRLGGLSEVICDNVTGVLIEPGNVALWHQVLQSLVNDPEPIRELGINGPPWVASRYNFAENLKSMVDLYEQTISS